MPKQTNYQNNPLHGVGLEALITEIVDHYGFEMLYAYLNINCFNTKPTIQSSVKFLKKTDWAREKVEAFYLYQFKSLPRASDEEFELPPRDRTIPQDQMLGEPAELSLEDAERLREKRAKKAAERGHGGNPRPSGPRHSGNRENRGDRDTKPRDSKPRSTSNSSQTNSDPWANWKNKSE